MQGVQENCYPLIMHAIPERLRRRFMWRRYRNDCYLYLVRILNLMSLFSNPIFDNSKRNGEMCCAMQWRLSVRVIQLL